MVSMKIVGIIEQFNKMYKQQHRFVEDVRRESKADFIIAVMSGDYLQQGIPASQDKFTRARSAVRAGVDLVLELPVCCALQSPDTYAYAAAALLDRLHCVDELYIACDTDQPELLPTIARLMFMETIEYQKEIQTYRHQGLTFYEAQAKAAGKKLPGAQDILKSPVNLFAAEYARALKRLYSTIRPCFIPAAPAYIAPAAQTFPASPYYTQLLKNVLHQTPDHLDDISGGTATLTDRILTQRHNITTFTDFAEQLATPTRSPANIRRYLFNLIFNIRKADIALCRLYGFALYAAPLAHSENAAPLKKHLQTTAWLPILQAPATPDSTNITANTNSSSRANRTGITNSPITAPAPLDDARQLLQTLDHRAHQLYLQSTHQL